MLVEVLSVHLFNVVVISRLVNLMIDLVSLSIMI